MESYYGMILRDNITGSDYGIMELYYGIMLWNYIMESSYENDPGDAWDVPGAPWAPRDPRGTPLGPAPLGPQGTLLGPPGTPLGPPGDAPGTPGTSLRRPRDAPETTWDPRDLQRALMDHKTTIFRQIYSARSSRLLCLKLPVRFTA